MNTFYKRALTGNDIADRTIDVLSAPHNKKIYYIFSAFENIVSFSNESDLNKYLRSKQAEYEQELNTRIQKEREKANKKPRKRKVSTQKKRINIDLDENEINEMILNSAIKLYK